MVSSEDLLTRALMSVWMVLIMGVTRSWRRSVSMLEQTWVSVLLMVRSTLRWSVKNSACCTRSHHLSNTSARSCFRVLDASTGCSVTPPTPAPFLIHLRDSVRASLDQPILTMMNALDQVQEKVCTYRSDIHLTLVDRVVDNRKNRNRDD